MLRSALRLPRNLPAALALALAGSAAVVLLTGYSPPEAWLSEIVGGSEEIESLASGLSNSLLQIALTAFVAEAALTLLGAQIIGATGNARRLRVLLSGTTVWAAALGSCLLVTVSTAIASVLLGSGSLVVGSVVIAMLVGMAAILFSVIALLLEQRAIIDPYRLAPRLAGFIRPSTVARFGFLRSAPDRKDGDASFRIVRYNLEFSVPDPMGPITEVFWQGIRERDRVLLQVVADSVAGQVCRSLLIPYERAALSALARPSQERLIRRMWLLREWRAQRGTATLLMCVHYLVRHGPNAVRELRLESARDPWLLSLIRLALSLSRYAELRSHATLVARAIVAVAAPMPALDPKSDQHAVLLLPTIAEELWNNGCCESAQELAMLCGYLKQRSDIPIDLGILNLSLRDRADYAASSLARDDQWLPRGSEHNRWVEMIPELITRQG